MKKQVFICNCKNDGKIKKENLDKLNKEFSSKNVNITHIDDICGSVIENPTGLRNLIQNKKSIVFGCEPRAMKWLLKYADVNGEDTEIKYHNINSITPESINSCFDKGESLVSQSFEYQNDTKPWFPVIDFEKCTHCRKCLNFCLFGVFSVNQDNKIVVTEPMNCKDMCPACSRVCSEQAIIFSKHPDSDLSGEIVEKYEESSSLVEQMQNNDVYSVLEKRRSKLNVRLLKKEQLKIAEDERTKCSCKDDEDCC